MSSTKFHHAQNILHVIPGKSKRMVSKPLVRLVHLKHVFPLKAMCDVHFVLCNTLGQNQIHVQEEAFTLFIYSR